MVTKKSLQPNSRGKIHKPLDFLFLLILVAVIPASVAIRLIYFEKSFGLEAGIIFPFALFSFLPLLLTVFLYEGKAVLVVAALAGLMQTIFITHHLATFVFWVLIGLLLAVLACWRLDFGKIGFNRWLKPLTMFLPIFFAIPVLLAFILFVTLPGSIADRTSFLFQMLWSQTILVWIIFMINALVVIILHGAGVLSSSKLIETTSGIFDYQSVPVFIVFLSVLWFILLLLATLIWTRSRDVELQSLADELQDTSAFVIQQYMLFLDYGKNSIHETAQIFATNGRGHEQQGIFDLLPFFQTISVYDNRTAAIHQLIPASSRNVYLPEEVITAISIVEEGDLPYYVVVASSGDTLSPDNLFYFLSPITEKQQTVIGYVDAKQHPLIQSSLHLFPDEAEWSLSDNQGGALYSSAAYANEIPDELLEKYENQYFFHPEIGEWVFVYPSFMGQFKIRISIAIQEGSVVAGQMELVQSGMLLLFFIGLIGSLSALAGYFLLRLKVNDLAADISSVGTDVFDPSMVKTGILEQPIYHALKTVHQKTTQETVSYGDWVAFLHGLSRVNSYDDLIAYLQAAAIFSGLLSIRFIIFPDIHQLLTDQYPDRFGKGSLFESMALYDDLVELGIKKQSPITFQISKMKKQINNGQPKAGGPDFVQAWALGTPDQNFGFVWLASAKVDSLRPFENKFFHLFVQELSRVIASFRYIQQIQTENRRTRSVIAAMPEPILVFDGERKLVLLNTAAEKLPGLQKNKIMQGVPMESLINDPALKGFLKRTLQHRTTVEELTLMDNKVYSGVLSVISGAGQVDWIICALHDVSTYQRKDTIRSEFLEAVGKYLQMPFQMVKGYLGMMTKVGDLNRAQLEYSGLIQGNIEEMEHFVSGILDINRIRSGAGLKIESVYATDIVLDAIKRIYPTARQNRITINMAELPKRELTKFEVDSALFGQAFFILLDNAVKFNKRDGKIDVQLSQEPGQIIFTVRDTGIGIAPLDIENIFRAGNSESMEQGSNHRGISLALSKSIIERHHGKIRAASWLGSGSVFTITMPITQEKTNKNAV